MVEREYGSLWWARVNQEDDWTVARWEGEPDSSVWPWHVFGHGYLQKDDLAEIGPRLTPPSQPPAPQPQDGRTYADGVSAGIEAVARALELSREYGPEAVSAALRGMIASKSPAPATIAGEVCES